MTHWLETLALLAGIATAAMLLWLIALLGRRARVVRILWLPFTVMAVAAGLKVSALFEAPLLEGLGGAANWVLFLGLTFLVLRLLGEWIFGFLLHQRRGLRLPPLIPAVAVGVACLITTMLTLKIVFPGLPLQPLVAGGAIGSLVLGLALQPILANFFAGLVLSLEKPYRINDWIKFADTEAQVVAINWRTTQLRTRDNDNMVVPNSLMAAERILNYYYPHPLHLARVEVGLEYKTPPYRAREALLAAAARVGGVLEKPSPDVYVHEFADSEITYELRIWIENIAQKPGILSQVREAIWEELRKRALAIPFPIRTLEIEASARPLEIVRGRQAAEPKATGARLFVAAGPDLGRTVALDSEALVVGRSSECGLPLSDGQASKEHLSIERVDGRYRLRDLGSRHGTRVNDQLVQERVLSNLDRIRVGETELVFESHGG